MTYVDDVFVERTRTQIKVGNCEICSHPLRDAIEHLIFCELHSNYDTALRFRLGDGSPSPGSEAVRQHRTTCMTAADIATVRAISAHDLRAMRDRVHESGF